MAELAPLDGCAVLGLPFRPVFAEMKDSEGEWYCFRTVLKKEHITSSVVSRQLSVETFCPRVSKIKQTRNGKRRFTEAMFPCYFFARISLESHLQLILRTHGVNSLVGLGGRSSIVDGEFIRVLRESLSNETLHVENCDAFKSNTVKFIDGPLRGLVGRIATAKTGGERVSVLLEFMGTLIFVKAPVSAIRKTGKRVPG